MILRSKEEVSFFEQSLNHIGFENITSFINSDEAYEHVIRNQYDIFLTRMEVKPISGVVLIQKIRETGNYGLETQLFLADKIGHDYIYTLQELEINYVLVKPFTVDRILEKMEFILKTESSLSEFEQEYRNAKSALSNNMTDMAYELVKDLLEKDPGNQAAMILMADIKCIQKKLDQAGDIYSDLCHRFPDSVPVKAKFAKWLMLNNRYEDAAHCLNDLVELNPFHISVLENAGLSNFEIGEYGKAKKYTEQLKAIDEDNEIASQVAGKVAFQEGRIEDSIGELASSMNSQEIINYINDSAIAFAKEKKFDKAIQTFNDSLEHIQENAFCYIIYFNLGLVYMKCGQTDSARVSFIKAIELNPDYEKAKVALRKVMSQSKQEGNKAS